MVVYKITVRDTVEERILALQEKKRELANAAVEGKAVGKLSMKDMMELFKHDGMRPTEETDVDFAAAMARGPVLKAGSTRVGSGASSGSQARTRQEDSLYGRRW